MIAGIPNLHKFFSKNFKKLKKFKFKKGFFKNPSFYFGVSSLVLVGMLFFNSQGLAALDGNKDDTIVFFRTFTTDYGIAIESDPFLSDQQAGAIEPPDLKIIQEQFVYGVSTPRVLTTQTMGAILGESTHVNSEDDVTDYLVQPGDTVELVAQQFNISVNTVLWANNLSKNSLLKAGQTLVILPVSGTVHIVKSGDTIFDIAKIYKADIDDIISFNKLTGEGDIFIGDILVVPNGIMPAKPVTSGGSIQVANSFFIFPTEGNITQGLHWYNAVDVANKCGYPVYAAASGAVQRAQYGWNAGGGNLITILHSNGVVTYYGHLMAISIKPGDTVEVGQRIGLMGNTGISTGCHLHFGVTGAKNPLAGYKTIKYK